MASLFLNKYLSGSVYYYINNEVIAITLSKLVLIVALVSTTINRVIKMCENHSLKSDE